MTDQRPRQAHNMTPTITMRWGGFLCGLLLIIVAPYAFSEDTFTVNTTNDSYYLLCNDSTCSLREAIVAANLSSGTDLVLLPAGRFTLTRLGSDEDGGMTGDLDISESVIIRGAGPENTIIDATGLGDRVFHVTSSGADVTFENLTITGGSSSDRGGGISTEAGSIVTIAESVITGNSATGATGAGGGIQMGYQAELSLVRSTVADNHAVFGGGIVVNSGSLLISRSTISHNSAIGASSFGGGLLLTGAATGSMSITNSTFYANRATDFGGAIVAYAGALATLNSVTIYDNGATMSDSDIEVQATSELIFTNALVSGACTGAGTATTWGGNLESPGDTCGFSNSHDQHDVSDLRLLGFGDYGGLTMTLMPRLDSPAIGAGTVDFCQSFDQRGVERGESGCDAGAVERDSNAPIFADSFENGTTTAWDLVQP